MNGVARQFWSEVFDVRTPVREDRDRRLDARRKPGRKALTRRLASPRRGRF
jgi:hypothetical protein